MKLRHYNPGEPIPRSKKAFRESAIRNEAMLRGQCSHRFKERCNSCFLTAPTNNHEHCSDCRTTIYRGKQAP